ncbi:MAG: 5-methyltetrahydropteroyltriglutamate--homocysteine S-methyltransferase [Rhodospirillales bacterium]|jgi:5-methyltetrahydropteroyltriglutamate--homocysteine methyltransferase
MSSNGIPFFHADHVGSLLRPQNLLDARLKWKAGEISRDELQELEDDAIREVVKIQEGVGLNVITDGEFRRENWWIDFISQINGINISEPDVGAEFKTSDDKGSGYVPLIVETVDKIHHDRTLMERDYTVLSSCTSKTSKVTIPSPTRIHFHSGRPKVSSKAYPDMEHFWDDVVQFYQNEIAGLEKLGCRYIQIDDPVLTYFLDDRTRDNLRDIGEDPDQLIHTYADVLNRCIDKRQDSTHLSMHLCRGNASSSWIVSGGYRRLAEAVFPVVHIDTWFLEYDDDRSGGFEPLEVMPDDKNVVLGLVTSKFGRMEDKDTLKRRIDEASKYVAMERLGISPQCGFASIDTGNLIAFNDQMAKLELVVETAEEVWG